MMRLPSARAFTLLEVLLAIGLIAALSSGIFAFMWQIGSQKSAMTERALDGQAGDAVFERIEADLAGAVAADSDGNAGIVGTPTSLKILSRSVGLPLQPGDDHWAAGDLLGTEYSYQSGSLSARRWDAHRSRASPQAQPETISNHIGAMRIRYFDGSAWSDAFDSKSKDGLPVAIEVSLWFGPPLPSDPSPAPQPAPDAPLDQDGNPLASLSDSPAPLPRPEERPDRIRVMVVPDGPTTAWKETR